jgi:hypothetical protein
VIFVLSFSASESQFFLGFRHKIRQDAIRARDTADPSVYEQQNVLAREIATIVRKNLVQATRIDSSDNPDTWSELDSSLILKIRPLSQLLQGCV